jgi:hypothetical protein
VKKKNETTGKETDRPLSHKRARAAAEYVGRAGGNMAEAMRLAGYSERTALHQSTRLLNDPQMQAEIARLLERHQLTDALAARKHAQLLEAQRQMRVGNEIRKLPDNSTQLRAVELYYKIKGYLRPPPHGLEKIVEHFTDVVIEVIIKYVETPEARHACLGEVIAKLQSNQT